MFGFPHRSTRAALLIEHIDENGEKKILMYDMGLPMSVSVEHEYNLWDIREDGRVPPHSSRVSIDAYLRDPRIYGHEFPGDQREIEPAQLAIESNEGEIVIDEEGFAEWQQEE